MFKHIKKQSEPNKLNLLRKMQWKFHYFHYESQLGGSCIDAANGRQRED